MLPLAKSLSSSLHNALHSLAHRPLPLLGVLLLANALFVPYLGIDFDAQIYSGLVLNRLDPGFLSGDLFFQFGSQDQYSIFSLLMAPLAQFLGLKTAFLLGYLASVTLFLAGMVRLTSRLWPDSPAAVAGLLFLSVAQITYGGFQPFHVIESFLSARLPASALAIWALTEFLDRLRFRGSLFLAASFIIHPLMAFPAILLLAFVALAKRGGFAAVLWASFAGLAALGIVLISPPLATRLFGEFDAQWLDLNRQTNAYQFPQDWFPEHWNWNLFVLAGLFAAAWQSRRAHAERSRVLAAAALVGAAGLFGSLLFTQFNYALLIKGQAYRWLWLPVALTPPALFDLGFAAWRTNRLTARLGAVALALGLGTTMFVPLEYACIAAFTPVIFYGLCIFAKSMAFAGKLSWTLLTSAIAGFAAWGIFRACLFLSHFADLREQLSGPLQWEVIVVSLAAGVIFPGLLLALALAGRHIAGARAATVLFLAAFLVQLGLYRWAYADQIGGRGPHGDDVRFVESFLAERRADFGQHLGIYSNSGRLGECWVDWRSRSYYGLVQLSGVVFNKDTAVEGKRRALLVAPFEAASLAKTRWSAIPEGCKNRIEAWLETSVANAVGPTEDDLFRLAREPSIDFIVLFSAHFDNLACARHGDVSIYDCRGLRESMNFIPSVIDNEPQVNDESE